MGRGHQTNRQTHRLCDYETNSAQRAELAKIMRGLTSGTQKNRLKNINYLISKYPNAVNLQFDAVFRAKQFNALCNIQYILLGTNIGIRRQMEDPSTNCIIFFCHYTKNLNIFKKVLYKKF